MVFFCFFVVGGWVAWGKWCWLPLVGLELGYLFWLVGCMELIGKLWRVERGSGWEKWRSVSYVQLVDLHDVYTHHFWRQHQGLVVEIVFVYMMAKSRVVLLRYILLGGLQSVAEIHNNLLLLIVPHFSDIFWGAKKPILIVLILLLRRYRPFPPLPFHLSQPLGWSYDFTGELGTAV